MNTTSQILPKGGIEYRGAIIEDHPWGKSHGFYWQHDDYFDAEWNGDGYSVYGCGVESTIEECKEAIDEFLEEKKDA